MTRLSLPNSPLVLGFGAVGGALGRAEKVSGDGYPPYNIERVRTGDEAGDAIRITLAVAGFARAELEIVIEDGQLIVRGKQAERSARVFLHRGIAARQFSRAFVLAEGVEIARADLSNGLLAIDLRMPRVERSARRIEIEERP